MTAQKIQPNAIKWLHMHQGQTAVFQITFKTLLISFSCHQPFKSHSAFERLSLDSSTAQQLLISFFASFNMRAACQDFSSRIYIKTAPVLRTLSISRTIYKWLWAWVMFTKINSLYLRSRLNTLWKGTYENPITKNRLNWSQNTHSAFRLFAAFIW